MAASAQAHHGGGVARGGISHVSAGRAGGYRGAPVYGHGGYAYGHGWRGYGWGGYGFGLGLALGASWYDPWYYPGYYPWYYGAPVVYDYAPPYSFEDVYDDEGPPPAAPATSAPPSAAGPGSSGQVCGQWVWHADQGRYQWVSSACTAPAAPTS
jgi:hypothetical protein